MDALLTNPERIAKDYVVLGQNQKGFYIPDIEMAHKVKRRFIDSGVFNPLEYGTDVCEIAFLVPILGSWYSNFVSGTKERENCRIRSLDDHTASIYLDRTCQGNTAERSHRIIAALSETDRIFSYNDATDTVKHHIDKMLATLFFRYGKGRSIISAIHHEEEGGSYIKRINRLTT